MCLARICDGHGFGAARAHPRSRGGPARRDHPRDPLAWRAPRDLLPAHAGIGVLDMAGNAASSLAVQTGALAIASVLSGLYPVTTVILATVFLDERVTRSHAVGIGLAAVAIA